MSKGFKGFKRFALVAVLSAALTLSAHAAGGFGTPVGGDSGAFILVPVFVGGLPLGAAVVSVD